MRKRLSYSSVVATLALFLAVGGTTAVGAQALLTGSSVKDGSLTSADIQNDSLTGTDIQNDSLTGADIRDGSLGSNALSSGARANLKGATGATGAQGEAGPAGPQGPAGVGVTATTATGADVTGYQDMDAIAGTTLPGAGDYVVFAHLTAHDSGASSDYLNCALFIGSQAVGGGGSDVTAGASSTFSVVGAISVSASQAVTLKCMGNSVTTFDLTDITIRTHNLG